MDYSTFSSWQFINLSSTGSYLNQLMSLSDTPVNSFSSWNWNILVWQIMDVLENPYVLWILLVLLIVSLFNFWD